MGMEVTCRSRRRPTGEESTKSGHKWEEMRREKSYVLNETTKLSPWDEYSVEEAGFQLKHKRALLWRQTKGTLYSKSIKIAKKTPKTSFVTSICYSYFSWKIWWDWGPCCPRNNVSKEFLLSKKENKRNGNKASALKPEPCLNIIIIITKMSSEHFWFCDCWLRCVYMSDEYSTWTPDEKTDREL